MQEALRLIPSAVLKKTYWTVLGEKITKDDTQVNGIGTAGDIY